VPTPKRDPIWPCAGGSQRLVDIKAAPYPYYGKCRNVPVQIYPGPRTFLRCANRSSRTAKNSSG